jgi:hypothetical protein
MSTVPSLQLKQMLLHCIFLAAFKPYGARHVAMHMMHIFLPDIYILA